MSIGSIRATLRWHYLTGVECDHESQTDVATCACAKWRSEPQPSYQAAVDAWVEHVIGAALLSARGEA